MIGADPASSQVSTWSMPAAMRSVLFVSGARTPTAIAVMTVAVLSCTSPFIWRETMRPMSFPNDGHARLSLDLAANEVLCGRRSMLSPRWNIAADLSAEPTLLQRPLRDLASRRAGTVDAYCASVTRPFVNNENSLMLIERSLLRVSPTTSIARVGQELWLVAVTMCVAFVAGLLAVGAPFGLTLLLFVCALTATASLAPYRFTVYPMILPCVLLYLGCAAWLLRAAKTPKSLKIWAACAVGGGIMAFAVNLRTSLAPTCVAVWLLSLAFVAVRDRARGLSRRVYVGAAAFVAAAWVFSWVAIAPLAMYPAYNSAHTIAHPLVLSLANPENELAASQGIAWEDAVGLRLAQRVDPNVTYLGPGYEPALFRFYSTLWQTHPREMLRLYLLKFSTAGSSIIRRLHQLIVGRTLWDVLMWPVGLMMNGLVVLACLIIAAATAARYALQQDAELPAFATLIAVVTILAYLESALTVSVFVLQYHGVELFSIACVVVGAAQAALEVATRAGSHAR
jgi:hypothetical protein